MNLSEQVKEVLGDYEMTQEEYELLVYVLRNAKETTFRFWAALPLIVKAEGEEKNDIHEMLNEIYNRKVLDKDTPAAVELV